jgi:hypothetical protein
MNSRLKEALLFYVKGTLTDPAGVDEMVMLALYKLRGESTDMGLRQDLDALIARVEKRGERYHLASPERMSVA